MYEFEDDDIAIPKGLTPDESRERLNATLATIAAEVKAAKARGDQIGQLDKAVGDLRDDLRGVQEAVTLAGKARLDRIDGPERELKGFIGDDTKGDRLRLYGQEVAGFYTPGLLDSPTSHGEWHREFKQAAEDFWLVALTTAGKTHDIRRDPIRQTAQRAPRSWKRLQWLANRAPSDIRGKIFDDDSTTGGEFIPTEIRLPRLDQEAVLGSSARLSGVFEVEPMSNDTVANPFISGGAIPYLQGVPDSDDPPQYTASTPTTAERTRTSKTLAVRMVIAAEATEDSILDNLTVLRNVVIGAQANGVEDAIINGDTAATHQDTGIAGWNIRSLWAASMGGSNDHRRAWIGLRARATDVSNTADGSGATTYANALAGQATLAAGMSTGAGLVIAASPEAFIKYILGMTEVATVDKYGPNASVLGGEVARVGQMRVIVSDLIDNQYNASGIYDDSTKTKTGILIFNRERFRIGRRRGALVEMDKDITRGVHNLVVTQRLVFYTIDASTTKNVYWRYNL